MRFQSRCACVLAVAGAAMPLSMTTTAQAHPPATVIVQRYNSATGAKEQVPGLPASLVQEAADHGVVITWQQGSSPPPVNPGLRNNAAIDRNGNILFDGQIAPTNYVDMDFNTTYLINSSNQNAVFYAPVSGGYQPSGISIIARDGQATSPQSSTTSGTPLRGGPTLSNPNGWWHNSATNTNGLTSGVTMSSNGTVFISSQLNGPGATATNNKAFFTGQVGSIAQAAIQGGAAPGTLGALFNTALNFAPGSNQVNTSGQVAFQSLLTGGDVVSGQNDSGLFVKSPSTGALIARRGQTPGVLGGAAFGAFTTNPGNTNINRNGDLIFNHTLSTTAGNATTSNDSVLMASIGGNLGVIAREGGAITVNGNAEQFASGVPFSVSNTNSSAPAFNNNGRVGYVAKFAPSANITLNTNDTAVMTWQGGTNTMLFQAGVSAAPGVAGATLSGFNFGNIQMGLNNRDRMVFGGSMSGGGVTTANDSGLWLADTNAPGNTLLIAREGDVAPNSGGLTFSNFFGTMLNNNGTVVFQAGLSGGGSGMFAWNYNLGLIDLVLKGDTSILGANYPVNSFGYLLTGNGDGGVASLNDNDQIVFNVSTLAGTAPFNTANFALVTMTIPAPGAGAVAMLGLAALGRRRR